MSFTFRFSHLTIVGIMRVFTIISGSIFNFRSRKWNIEILLITWVFRDLFFYFLLRILLLFILIKHALAHILISIPIEKWLVLWRDMFIRFDRIVRTSDLINVRISNIIFYIARNNLFLLLRRSLIRPYFRKLFEAPFLLYL